MSDNQYRRNHYVPKGYLRGFSLPDNTIYQLSLNEDLKEGKISKRGLNQVAFEWDLYTIKETSKFQEFDIDNDNKYIEKNCFNKIENRIGKVIEKINNGVLGVEEKQVICDFILLSFTRHPKNLDLFMSKYSIEMHIQYLEENKTEIVESARLHNDFRSFEELKITYLEAIQSKKEFQVENLAKSYLQSTLLNLDLNPEYERMKMFKSNALRKFTIYKSFSGMEFITSLHPANSFHPQVGFNKNLLDSSSYTIPLSKTIALEIGGKPNLKEAEINADIMSVNDSFVDFINFTTIQNSLGKAFGANKDLLTRYSTQEFYDEQIERYKAYTKTSN